MEYRPLEITVISAKDLKDVNLFTKMDVYAVLSISGDPQSKQKTPVDREGGTSPSWNSTMKFTVVESAAQQNRLTLIIQLRCDRSLGDKDIGEVHVPVKELLDTIGEKKPSVQFVSYQVRKPSGKPKGVLNLSYKFGEKFTNTASFAPKAHDEPVTAYPAPAIGSSSAYPAPHPPGSGPYPQPVAGYGYPPQEAGYGHPPPPQQPFGGYPQQPGYGYPPQQGYGYPPQQGYGYTPQQGYGYPPQQGYGYPPVQQPAKKNNKLGLGLGAGLLGGALGGLLIGDMVSDAGGYDDGGFGDMGGDF